jgi:hypothetical protein
LRPPEFSATSFGPEFKPTTTTASEKQFVWFENSAHLPMTEEPGKFLISLARHARPIAEKAGDAAS